MKIADVTVGTEYAYNPYGPNETDWVRLSASGCTRVLVTNTHSGGKVTIETWDRHSKTFRSYSSSPVSARGLIMRWDEAQPIFKEIRESRERRAREGQERVAREQIALRRLGAFLDGDDNAGSIKGLPYTLQGAIGLARGDEGLKDMGPMLGVRPTHRHEPQVNVNVTTLVTLLDMAYGNGYDDAVGGSLRAAWTQGDV